ncbi:hypothetical protein IJ22_18080 [Paenibacillus naphthalenovorans]|uniref:Uncharacterized protein n=2 Tax=Paenibacillus naphthalenovorans TaxID=162209 RepID=A0A0U2VN82_9BACL|nr:hypothetical protein IJ22_18080 [Paenibacillus naphthalenovorans]
MYLYVKFTDTFERYINMVNGIDGVPVHERVVRVKFTDEQIELLHPRKVGVDCGKDVLEYRTSI